MTSASAITNPAQLTTAIHTTLVTHASILMPQYVPLMKDQLEQPKPLVELPDLEVQLEELPSEFEPTSRKRTYLYSATFSLHDDIAHLREIVSSSLDVEPAQGSDIDADAYFRCAIGYLTANGDPDIINAISKLGVAAQKYKLDHRYPAAAAINEISARYILGLDNDAKMTVAMNNLQAAWNWYQSLLCDQNPATFEWRALRALYNASLAEQFEKNGGYKSAGQCIRDTMFFTSRFNRSLDNKGNASASYLYLLWRETQDEGRNLHHYDLVRLSQFLDSAVKLFGGDATSQDIFKELREYASAVQSLILANQA